jgi:hypothetical protein
MGNTNYDYNLSPVPALRSWQALIVNKNFNKIPVSNIADSLRKQMTSLNLVYAVYTSLHAY